MARTDTLPHFLTDIADAIRTKGGTSESIQASSFDDAIANLPSGAEHSGHYDATGLAQIGWTTDDINYYQENGVLWDQEDDATYELNNVELNKTAGTSTRFIPKDVSSINFTYYYRLLGMPLVDTSNKTSFNGTFQSCYSLITIPLLNTQNTTNMQSMFNKCNNLRSIPLLNTQNVSNMSYMFYGCVSLETIPLLNTQNVSNMSNMFYGCNALRKMPLINTSNVSDFSSMFYNCYALVDVPAFDLSSATNLNSMFASCPSLSDNSLNNILAMCISATSFTGTKKLSSLGIYDTFLRDRIPSLSNYQDFLNAGWTIS